MTREMIDASSSSLASERLVMGESVFKFEEESQVIAVVVGMTVIS